MSRILVTGASGFLGHTLCRDLSAVHDVTAGCHTHSANIAGCSTARIDITDAAQVETRFDELRPDVVVHAAAMAQPDECEQSPDSARSVIVDGTRNLVLQSRRHGCRLFYISTDLVFDGEKGSYTEQDLVRGISVYSTCKIRAEELVGTLDPSAVVLRVSVLYGPGSPFNPGALGSMLAAWRAGRPLTFYTDQFRSPTFGPRVSLTIQTMLNLPDLRGVFHVGGAERLSRYDFALLVARFAAAAPELVRPGSMYHAGAVAPRGADCSLVSEKLRAATGLEPLRCSAALDALARTGFLRL